MAAQSTEWKQKYKYLTFGSQVNNNAISAEMLKKHIKKERLCLAFMVVFHIECQDRNTEVFGCCQGLIHCFVVAVCDVIARKESELKPLFNLMEQTVAKANNRMTTFCKVREKYWEKYGVSFYNELSEYIPKEPFLNIRIEHCRFEYPLMKKTAKKLVQSEDVDFIKSVCDEKYENGNIMYQVIWENSEEPSWISPKDFVGEGCGEELISAFHARRDRMQPPKKKAKKT